MAFCKSCGAQLTEGRPFCTSCGAPQPGAGPAPAPQQFPQYPQQPPQYAPQTVPRQAPQTWGGASRTQAQQPGIDWERLQPRSGPVGATALIVGIALLALTVVLMIWGLAL